MKRSPERQHNPEQERLENLKNNFRSIFEGENIDSASAEALFNKIADAYQSEGRTYHNLEHINHLLTFLQNKKSDIKDWKAVQLATWFHDVVYATKAHDNEAQSAKQARQELEALGIDEETIKHVELLVMATAKHQVVEGENDSAIFLDGDLSILGAIDAEYDKYAEKIRQEYSWVPEEQYKQARKNILKKFIKRERIYFTDEAHQTLEKQARKNLQREIEQLS